MEKVAFFDFDNTLYSGMSYFDILRFHIDQGIVPQSINSQTQRVVEDYKKGTISYEAAAKKLLENYAQALATTSYDTVVASTKTFFDKNSDKFYPYAGPIIRLLQPTHQLFLVTASPQFVAQSAAELLGIKQCITTTFEVMGDRLTGTILDNLAFASDKAKAVKAHVSTYEPKESFAFGDSEGDMAMLEMVEHAVCINPTAALKQAATDHPWPIATAATIEELVRQRL